MRMRKIGVDHNNLVRKKDVVACGGELDKSNIPEKLQRR